MKRYRVTALAPIRYAFWPAQPTRKVGTTLYPGDCPLELTERQYRDVRMVVIEDGADVPVLVEMINVSNAQSAMPEASEDVLAGGPEVVSADVESSVSSEGELDGGALTPAA